MSQVNRINTLPLAIKEELDARIISAGGGGYESHSMWLQALGYRVSRSAVHRYGQGLQDKIKQARNIAQARIVARELGVNISDIHPDSNTQTLIVLRDRVTGWSCELTSRIPAVELEKKLREVLEAL
jgi:hypothetical protein